MTKPMLATDVEDFETLRYPLYGSFKIDGVRALMPEQTLMPRSLKKFGNQATVDFFSQNYKMLNGFDGELTLGPKPNLKGERLCHLTSSAMASHDGEPEIHWHIFDFLPLQDALMPFKKRFSLVKNWFDNRGVAQLRKLRLHMVEQTLIRTPAEALRFHETALERGFEGTVFKDPEAPYKFGRSTLKSQHFLRYKPLADAEGEIVELVELQRNGNEATINNLGHQVRSSHRANKTGGGTLGAIKVRILTGPFKGKIVKIGTGWDAALAEKIWMMGPSICGKNTVVKFSYFPIGCKDLPRHPVFQGFREKFDMS